ncbi:MAG: hypothetical protein ABI718_14130 [Acidobacteriota bacterium]
MTEERSGSPKPDTRPGNGATETKNVQSNEAIYGEMRVYSRPGDRTDEGDPDIDYRAEGNDPNLTRKEPNGTDAGYDEAAHTGASRYGVAEGSGGVFGTTGGGSYEGGFQIEERPALYDRDGEPDTSDGGSGSERQERYGRDPDRFDEVLDSDPSKPSANDQSSTGKSDHPTRK